MHDPYRETQKTSEGPRAEEYRRLGELTAHLMAAEEARDLRLRTKALQENQRFWQSLRLNSISAAQSLPKPLRQQFTKLADWVVKESVMVGLNQGSLGSLIAVNKQIMEGLKPYEGSMAGDKLAASNANSA